jgi:hypothetical protein
LSHIASGCQDFLEWISLSFNSVDVHSNLVFRFCGTEANRQITVEVTVIWFLSSFTRTKQQQTGKFHGLSAFQNVHQQKADSYAPNHRRFSKIRIQLFLNLNTVAVRASNSDSIDSEISEISDI